MKKALIAGSDQVVALQMYGWDRGWEPQSSGWHGSWQVMGNAFHIWVHYRGDERHLVPKRIALAVPHGSVGGTGAPQPTAFAFCGSMADRNADVHVSFSIQTCQTFLLKQLPWEEPSVEKLPEWLFVEEPSVEKLS